jgi:transcriptional regulator with XRE-family HTH domain
MYTFNHVIADNLKNLRKERHLSLDKASQLTGVSKSMISQIEKGIANPSVTTLWKLANGFKISFTQLMSTPENESELIPIETREPLLEDSGRYRNFPIVLFDPIRRFETYLIEIEPNGHLAAEPHPEGTQEYITVISGELHISTGDIPHVLKQSDTLRFKADCPHTYDNKGMKLCTLHMILYYPQII